MATRKKKPKASLERKEKATIMAASKILFNEGFPQTAIALGAIVGFEPAKTWKECVVSRVNPK